MSSPTDQVIKLGPALVLRAAGFRKQARAFIRQFPDLFHIIRFDNGKHASADFGHFHVSILVVIPFTHEAVMGTPFPTNPARAQNCIGKLLQYLSHKPASPWGVFGSDDVASTARDIAADIQASALPFLDGLSALSAVADHLDANLKAAGPDDWFYEGALHLAAIRCHQNRHTEASLLLDRSESSSSPGFVECVKAVRGRLAL